MENFKAHVGKLTWRFLPTTRGQSAIVDAHKLDELRKGSWHFHKAKGKAGGYASRYVSILNGKQTAISMHRQLLGLTEGDPRYGEHINGNGMDNRLANLRHADNSQNQANREASCTNTSGYKGVCWHKVKKLWIVNIRVKGRRIHIGYFPIEKLREAGAAYDKAANFYFGEFARQRSA